MDKVMHFEIPADNMERAQKFYHEVFGWKVNPVPNMEYTVMHTVEVDEKMMPKESGAINGGIMKKSKEIKNPVITIVVKNMDEAMKKLKEHGGKLFKEKMEVPGMGYAAYFKDSEGNIMGLFEPMMK
jgi:uncharacterized protein